MPLQASEQASSLKQQIEICNPFSNQKSASLVVWLAIALLTAAITQNTVDQLKRDYLASVDQKLYTAAMMAKAILGENYHDNLMNQSSISAQQYVQNVDKFNQLSSELGLQYLWSNLFIEDDVVFTSSTSMSKEVSLGDHAWFFEKHRDPHAFDQVKRNATTTYSTFENEWGKGRMVLIPFLDSSGRTYVFGASVALESLSPTSLLAQYSSATAFLLVSLLGYLFTSLIKRSLDKQLNQLATAAAQISEGEPATELSFRASTPGMDNLVSSIRHMGESIRTREVELLDKYEHQYKLLQKKESHLAGIIAATAESIITIDARGTIETINPAAEKLFQYPAREIVGKNIGILIPETQRNNHQDYLNNSKLTKTRVINRARDLKGQRKDGGIFEMELTVAKMPSYDGDHFVGALHDVTQRVRDREKLVEMKIAAEQANRAKSDFLSRMSHELRTPLNSIIGFSQVLVRDKAHPLSVEQLECVNFIHSSGEHLLQLVNGVLDIAQVESGNSELTLTDVEVNKLFHECKKLTEPLAEEYGINLSLDVQSDSRVQADNLRLKQILLNLLTNAIKYNGHNGNVTLRYTQESKRGLIEVSDDGPGFDPMEQEVIFEPFNRLGAESSDIPGTGIGLAITKQLVELMDADLTLISSKGHGASFRITLNTTSELKNNQKIDSNSTPDTQIELTGTILYIEDNPTNIRLMERIFNNQTASLITAASAEDGLRLIKKLTPSAVIMDINLPGMSGIEALQLIRNNPEIPNIPCIALSGAAMPHDIQKGTEFNAYITKPYKITELLQTLLRVLKHK